MKQREPSIRVILLPRDTNEMGTIFGGVILSYIDSAGAVEARKHANKRFVTVAMDEVVFKKPVLVGDIVSFYTDTIRVGTTSVTVKVVVDVIRRANPKVKEVVTEAQLTFVAVDEQGRPTPVAV
jgi:acyl-CoA thioesterase YciA